MGREKRFCEKGTLDKLTDVFWQQGYNGASMDDLLKQSGLSRSSLYATYGDKRTLFLQSLQTYVDKQAYCMAAAEEGWANTGDAIDYLYDYVINAVECSCNKGCFVVNAAVEWGNTDEEVLNILKANRQNIIDTLVRIIERDMKNGNISDKETPENIALFIFNNLSGIQVSARAGQTKETLQQIKQMVLRAVR